MRRFKKTAERTYSEKMRKFEGGGTKGDKDKKKKKKSSSKPTGTKTSSGTKSESPYGKKMPGGGYSLGFTYGKVQNKGKKKKK
jgi:hypothetical protein